MASPTALQDENIHRASTGKEMILVDHREHAEMLLNELRDEFHVTIRIEELKVGDYSIPPDTIVERKTVDDFCLSIIDGRLFRQAYRLSSITRNPVILIEGKSFTQLNHKITLDSVKGALVTLAQTFRIPVLRSRNQTESAWYLHCLLQQRKRIGQKSGVLTSSRPKRLSTQKVHVLRSLPGVGPKLANNLLAEFVTIENICKANQKDLEKIPGLGKRKLIRSCAYFAKRLRAILFESAKEFDNSHYFLAKASASLISSYPIS